MGEISVAQRTANWRPLDGATWLLIALLTLLAAASFSCERRVSDLTESEMANYLQTASLLHERDLAITEDDRERARKVFGDRWADFGEGAASDPESESFDPYWPYALLAAPFVAAIGLKGPVVLNSILLIVAVWLASRQVRRRLGSDTSGLLVVFVFGTVTYRSVFLIQPQIFLLAIVVAAVSLALRSEEPAVHELREMYQEGQRTFPLALTWLAVGLLVGTAVIYHPLYGIVALPLVFAMPDGRRKLTVGALVVGVAAIVATDLPDLAILLPSKIDVGLAAWNGLYLIAGRNIGLLPYFLPLVLSVGLSRGGDGRTTLWVAAFLGAIGFATLMPFNIFGGPASVGNGWVLPLMGLLWFVPARPLPRNWLWIAVLFAAPLMYASWAAGSIDLVGPKGTYRHASNWVAQWLPAETSQQQIPNGGEIRGPGLWVRSLDTAATPNSGGRWTMESNRRVQLIIASTTPVASLYLQFGPQAEPDLEVEGGTVGNMILAPDGGVAFQVEDLTRRGLHPMWWSPEKHHLYVLTLRMHQPESRLQSLTIRAFGHGLGS